MKPIKILIFEDNNDMRNCLIKLVSNKEGLILAGAFPDCMKAEIQVKKLQPDVILMDIDMPGITGIQAVKLIRHFDIDVRILILTVFETDEKIFDALRVGASGYLLKKNSPSAIIEAIENVYDGGAPMTSEIAKRVLKFFSEKPSAIKKNYNLTLHEKATLDCLTRGFSYKMIAAQLKIKINTVRFHIKQTYFKLHVNSATEAVAKALREQIV